MQLPGAVGAGLDAGVVAGADGVEPEGDGLVQQRRELDVLVAAHARVRGPAGLVLGDEVGDDGLLEPLGQVPHVVRDAQHVGRAAGVAGVLDRAAPARAGAELVPRAGQGHVHADDVVPGVDRARRGDRGVDAAGQGGQDAHQDTARRSRARRRGRGRRRPAAPRAARRRRRRSTVCPRLNRSAPRAATSSTPIASSTWLGRGTPAWQADPVDASIPAESSR